MEFPDADKIGAAGDFFLKIGSSNLALAAAFLFLISLVGFIFFRNSHEGYRVFAFLIMVGSGATILFIIFFPRTQLSLLPQADGGEPKENFPIFDSNFERTIGVIADDKYSQCVKDVSLKWVGDIDLTFNPAANAIVDSSSGYSKKNFSQVALQISTMCLDDFAVYVAIVHCGDGSIYDNNYQKTGAYEYFVNSYIPGVSKFFEFSILFLEIPDEADLRLSVYLWDFGAPPYGSPSDEGRESNSKIFTNSDRPPFFRPVCST